MQPFKSGTGLLAVETGVPVLPMRIDVLRPGFYEGKWLPHPRARVRVSIGEPVRFSPGTDYLEATAKLERAVREATVLSDQLQGALQSRVSIEQAKGALAQIHGVGVDAAFDLMRRYARSHNRPLSAVARDVVLAPSDVHELTRP